MTGLAIKNTKSNSLTVKSEQVAALREASKIGRLALTDAVKKFSTYIDPKGNASTCPERAYVNFTRMIYRPFGLNKAQRDALEAGENTRDNFDTAQLRFVTAAEDLVARILVAGMRAKELRDVIKDRVKRTIELLAGAFNGNFEGVTQ